MGKECYKLTLYSEDEFMQVVAVIGSIAAKYAIAPAIEFKITLALDELISNVFNYAFVDGDVPEVEVIICAAKGKVFAKVVDTGMPFDSSALAKPELDVPIEKRTKPVGGMGVHLVRNMMDSFAYYRHGNKNTVLISWTIEPENRA